MYVCIHKWEHENDACMPCPNGGSGFKKRKSMMEIFVNAHNQTICRLIHSPRRTLELSCAISDIAKWTMDVLAILWNDTLNTLLLWPLAFHRTKIDVVHAAWESPGPLWKCPRLMQMCWLAVRLDLTLDLPLTSRKANALPKCAHAS